MFFGVIDRARDKKGLIAQALAQHGEGAECLFAGRLHDSVRRRAPYLIPLPAGSTFGQFWHERGWQDNWGVLLSSDRTQAEVRRHLRQFLRAQLPDGRVVMFRFYDPRILPTYLRTCTAAELAVCFAGIVTLFRVPSNSPRRYTDFSFDGVGLVER